MKQNKKIELTDAYHQGYDQGRFDEYADRMGKEQAERVRARLEKQKNCLFCHKANGFTKKSSSYQSFFSRTWEEGFKQILGETKIVNPKNIVHGIPFRYSMMVWTKGFQAESLIIYDLRTSKDEEVTVTPGFLAPFYCPICGRPLGKEVE